KVGDRISEGSLILMLETGQKGAAPTAAAAAPPSGSRPAAPAPKPPVAARAPPSGWRPAAPAPKPPVAARGDHHAEVLVLGAGPGGYTAAFRAADLGKKVVLVERWPSLGGVCLNGGCIASKARLHAAKVIEEAHEVVHAGLSFAAPAIDLDKLRGWKDGV